MNSFEQIWGDKYRFFAIFFIVFTISYLFLVAMDWLPEKPSADEEHQDSAEVSSVEVVEEAIDTDTNEEIETLPEVNGVATSDFVALENAVLPTSINIPKLGREVTVLNPVSRSIADLDDALLNGVVRHPDSATLEQEGNVFILGHSSYLPNVFNDNFQAFNGLQDLAWGDKIEVTGDGKVYEYRVEKVYKADATDTTVPIAGDEHRLILATCNSFGSIDDRFIVEAKRISS